MKKIAMTSLVLLSLSAFGVSAASLDHSISTGTSHSVTAVDRVVSGSIKDTTVKYATDRAGYSGPSAGCGTVCDGSNKVDNDVVSASLAVTVKDTKMNEKTTGSSVSSESFCETSISGGQLTATQGNKVGSSSSNTVTDKNNVTTIKGFAVSVETSTNGDYPGLGKGNDVQVQVNGKNSFSTNAAQGFTVDTSDLSADKITVTGFDGTSGTENGMATNVVVTDLKVEDKSKTTATSSSNSEGTYSSLN